MNDESKRVGADVEEEPLPEEIRKHLRVKVKTRLKAGYACDNEQLQTADGYGDYGGGDFGGGDFGGSDYA